MDLTQEEKKALQKLFNSLSISRLSHDTGISINTLYSMRDSTMSTLRQKNYDAIRPLLERTIAAEYDNTKMEGQPHNPTKALLLSKIDKLSEKQIEKTLAFVLTQPEE